ncbi:cation diffusion facilitator family transporter [Pseudanabaena sp. FACHB-2040]|uniref:cation diffusion facilitator family transporter n=1 Tax=Pseudanabaena sp. FACHB-2040 TaxID=2692859 RepID=UPI0016864731|nr:cation diffusion facilitator family transporter [Pseudanabaena sp. FACHB-2040]MBD0267661.1 cation diffusion facilitator family transporter [Cyanobacteria bacterium Co-bin8]MBD2256042.1 cation diffusion facilitator family transporter [Pseudanabaena sp. FACHB-2040]
MSQSAHPRQITYRLLLTTLWAVLLTLTVEASAGWASQSLTLLAESLHTLVDGFSTLLSLIAIASPQRPLGREVWGHGRLEVGITLMLTGFLGFTGVSLLWVALRQIYGVMTGSRTALPVSLEPQIVQFTAIMVILTVALGIYSGYQARTLDSLSLRLNTQHFLQDAWLSLVMVAVLIAIRQDQQWLDPVFAIALLTLLPRSLWRVLNAQLPMLLQPTAIAPEAISHTATQVEGVTRCIRIRSRGMVGRQVWIELHLALHPEFMDSAEHIGEQIEAALRQRYGPLRAQIWVEETQSYSNQFAANSNPLDSPGYPPHADWN